jgi:antitoxin component YwqK of YwqJK toxin-antitoxin module
MITINKPVLFFSIFSLFFINCSDKPYETEVKMFLLEYSTGQKYCEGNYLVYSKDENSFKKRDGIWKFYDLNGQPMRIEEYDLNDRVSYKEFNENGKVGMSQVWNSTTHILSRYYFNGNLKYEEITTFVKEDEYAENYDGQSQHYETKTEYITIKEYHLNGQLKLIEKREDGYTQGYVKIFDEKGNLVLKFEAE